MAEFTTLYGAEQRRGCFIESLARFRPSPAALLAMQSVVGAPDPAGLPVVPSDWCTKRAIGRFRLLQDQRWLDLRSLETREALRVELAKTLVQLGMPDLDVSSVRSLNRQFTQAVARWAYEHGFAGIAYGSRLDDALDCWAVFRRNAIQRVDPVELIVPSDPDFREIQQLFGLVRQPRHS